MELINLHDLMLKTREGFNSSIFTTERTLPASFKEAVPSFDGTRLDYQNYTCVLVERTPGLNIIFPNQWFYIAAYMTNYYNMIVSYKQKVFDILKLDSLEIAKNTLRDVVDKEDDANKLFDNVNYNGSDREWLVKFISDYSWWGGGKSIDRNDFFVSPILSLAHLVNASQGFVAELCKFLAEHNDALNLLKDEFSHPIDAQKSTTVNYAIIRSLKESYTIEELAKILSDMYNDLSYVGLHLFGLKYGSYLFNVKLKDLCTLSKIPESYTVELSKMRNLYKVIKERKYGVCFYEDFNFNPTKTLSTAEDNAALSTFYLTAMQTKPFLLLAGISGTGKSRIVKQMAFESCPDIPALRSDKTAPGNYELIEVKPNWHDSSELLGYESEIGGPHYVVTPFVRFLVKAMRYPDVPFFVCMDEMNLAPVEQYFAEFLSVLESRKLLSDGTITSEPLIKADIFSKYADQLHRDLDITDAETYKAVYDRLKNDGLRLPSNLIVVGTVNMDETTHQFSRKVIDRAMTIEMNIEDSETPFKNFFEGGDALHYYDNPQPKELFLPKVVQASEALSILRAEDASYLKENVPGLLHSLNSALNGTPFKIAYRVQNELILYFFSLREENPDEAAEALLAQAMDAILMMKVLPRIEGDEDLLDKPLKALAQFTENYPQASRKIAEMQERLPRAHFTSFWP